MCHHHWCSRPNKFSSTISSYQLHFALPHDTKVEDETDGLSISTDPLCSALTTALVVRLGHHLGANQPKKTKLCVMLASTIGLVFVFIDSILLYANRSTIAHAFSRDDQVVDAVIELLGVGSLAHFAMVCTVTHFVCLIVILLV